MCEGILKISPIYQGPGVVHPIFSGPPSEFNHQEATDTPFPIPLFSMNEV